MELNTEYIEKLREGVSLVRGDLKNKRFIQMKDMKADVVDCLPDTIITTITLSEIMAKLLKESCHLVGTRLVSDIECAEFMTLAPFALRIALLGTNYCPEGEYIMFREPVEQEDGEEPVTSTVLVRQGIQG